MQLTHRLAVAALLLEVICRLSVVDQCQAHRQVEALEVLPCASSSGPGWFPDHLQDPCHDDATRRARSGRLRPPHTGAIFAPQYELNQKFRTRSTDPTLAKPQSGRDPQSADRTQSTNSTREPADRTRSTNRRPDTIHKFHTRETADAQETQQPTMTNNDNRNETTIKQPLPHRATTSRARCGAQWR